MEIIDTYSSALTSYDGAGFSVDRWKKYIDSALPGLFTILAADAKSALLSGEFSPEDYLSVLNLAARCPERLEAAHASFLRATENLESVIYERFGKSLDAAVVFYLGLCNGAGWVTDYLGETSILLGVEKILELNWCRTADMRGLICHELGHAYQNQHGVLRRAFDDGESSFLWQLFTEGVAMCFEQAVVGDSEFFHQDKCSWEAWCDANFGQIKADFARDLRSMTPANQRYFGDWADYFGRGDVGYYLGARFVQFILKDRDFDDVIGFGIDEVREWFGRFMGE